VYLPVESPTNDFYGGHRAGNNLFGETLVCVDLRTGERKWHFNWCITIVGHGYFFGADLADITVDEKAVKAVALPTKQGFLYVFDRVTENRCGRLKKSRWKWGLSRGMVFADAADSIKAAGL